MVPADAGNADPRRAPGESESAMPESESSRQSPVPESRQAYRGLLAQGWTDAIRHLHPGAKVYTFWEYTRGAWRRDAGLRIDHLLLNPAAAGRLAGAGVDRDVRGWEKTSDHAPAWVELRDA